MVLSRFLILDKATKKLSVFHMKWLEPTVMPILITRVKIDYSTPVQLHVPNDTVYTRIRFKPDHVESLYLGRYFSAYLDISRIVPTGCEDISTTKPNNVYNPGSLAGSIYRTLARTYQVGLASAFGFEIYSYIVLIVKYRIYVNFYLHFVGEDVRQGFTHIMAYTELAICAASHYISVATVVGPNVAPIKHTLHSDRR